MTSGNNSIWLLLCHSLVLQQFYSPIIEVACSVRSEGSVGYSSLALSLVSFVFKLLRVHKLSIMEIRLEWCSSASFFAWPNKNFYNNDTKRKMQRLSLFRLTRRGVFVLLIENGKIISNCRVSMCVGVAKPAGGIRFCLDFFLLFLSRKKVRKVFWPMKVFLAIFS